MKKYKFYWTWDNGFNCSCHGESYEETEYEEFETDEEAIKYASSMSDRCCSVSEVIVIENTRYLGWFNRYDEEFEENTNQI